MSWKVEGQKIRGTTGGLISQDDNRSVFCGFAYWNRLCQKASKCQKLQDFVRFYNVRTPCVFTIGQP